MFGRGRPPSWILSLVIILTCASVCVAQPAGKDLQSWCRDCPPGEEQTSYCNSTHPTQCRPCSSGFFSPSRDRIPCRPCSACAPGYIRVTECTKSRDTQCVHKALLKTRPAADVTASVRDELAQIDAVDSSYFTGKINEAGLPQGPPVDNQYNSGPYRGRETLGVDSGEAQPLQPSQTPPQGGHPSRQVRETTPDERSLDGITPIPSAQHNDSHESTSVPYDAFPDDSEEDDDFPYRRGPPGPDGERGPQGSDPGRFPAQGYPSNGPGPQGPAQNGQGAGENQGTGGLWPQRHPGQEPGNPPGSRDPPGEKPHPGPGLDPGIPEGILPEHEDPPPRGGGVDNKRMPEPDLRNNKKNADMATADSSSVRMNQIMTYAVGAVGVMVLLLAAVGLYMNRGRFRKPRPVGGDTSCATYDKDEGGVTLYVTGDKGYRDDHQGDGDSLYIRDIAGLETIEAGRGSKKIQNSDRPSSSSDNIPLAVNPRTTGGDSGHDDFSRVVDETLESAGNQCDGYNGFTDTLRPASSRGRLMTDGGGGGAGGKIFTEFANPLFTGDNDVETDGPGASRKKSRGSPAPPSGGISRAGAAPSGGGPVGVSPEPSHTLRSSPAPSGGMNLSSSGARSLPVLHGGVNPSRASPTPSTGSSGLTSVSNRSVLDSLAKDAIKPSNVNFNTTAPPKNATPPINHHPQDPLNPYTQSSHPHPHPHPRARPTTHHRSYKMSDSENSFGGLFSNKGGKLRAENSAVSLRVPRGAVPADQTWAIRGYIHLDLQPFIKHIDWEGGECMISPIPEYHVVDGHTFHRMVHIRIPHCLDQQELMPHIRVQHGDPVNNKPFQDVPPQAKENNIRQDVYFSVEENFINIYTSHFTQFICSCKKPYNLQLEAMLFGSYSWLGEQEVKLRLYLCDPLINKVDDFRQDLIKRERHNLLESRTVALPSEGLTAQSDIEMELQPKDSDWETQTICGLKVSELKQTMKLGDLVCCHASRYEAPVAADFVMVPKPKAETKTFFKGAAFITPRVLHSTPTKQKKKKFGVFGGKTKTPDKDAERADDCKPTIIWFGFSFGYEVQRNQPGDAGDAVESSPDEDEGPDEETLEVFEYISKHLPRNSILPLSRRLGLEQTLVEEIEERYRHSLQEQKMQMLLLWQRRKAGRATVDQLMKHLVRLQQTELVEELAEILEMEMDEMAIPDEKEKLKIKRTKQNLKVPAPSSKRSHQNSNRAQNGSRTKRDYFSQSSPESADPVTVPSRSNIRGSEGYTSSGSNRPKSSKHKNSRDRPHLKIANGTSVPNVEITKDQVPKRTSKLRQQQQHQQQQQSPHRQRAHKHKQGLPPSCDSTGSTDSENAGSDLETIGDNSVNLGRQSGVSEKQSGRFDRRSGRSDRHSGVSAADSDLIVSEGGSDIAEVSEAETDEEEVATSTMLDCGKAACQSETDPEEECSSPEPTSPDSLIHQTVPKTLDEHYRLEHVNV